MTSPRTGTAITAISFVRTATMRGATTGTEVLSSGCGPIARSVGPPPTKPDSHKEHPRLAPPTARPSGGFGSPVLDSVAPAPPSGDDFTGLSTRQIHPRDPDSQPLGCGDVAARAR